MRNRGFSNYHNSPWKKYMKQNKMETKVQLKRGKMQLRPVPGTPTAGFASAKMTFS